MQAGPAEERFLQKLSRSTSPDMWSCLMKTTRHAMMFPGRFTGSSMPRLTTELRSRLNSAVRQLNEVLSEVAEELWVIFVGGIEYHYETYRFCEAPRSYFEAPIGKITWFWHNSPNYLHGGEGPDDVSPGPFEDLSREVLRVLLPDEKMGIKRPKKASIAASNKTHQFSQKHCAGCFIRKEVKDLIRLIIWLPFF